MPPAPPRFADLTAIVFDCDGVIIDTETAWDHSNTEFLARRGHTYVRAEHKPLLTGRGAAEGAAVIADLLGFDGDVEAMGEERLAITRTLLPGVGFLPGFHEFFARVRHLPVAVATGMNRDTFTRVDALLGLTDLFDGRIVVASEVPEGKPAPDVFLAALALLPGVAAADCLVIEDAPLGIEAATRAGMPSMGLATTYPVDLLAAASFVVDGWAAALRWLDGGAV